MVEARPRVSIIVPVYNEEECFPPLYDALKRSLDGFGGGELCRRTGDVWAAVQQFERVGAGLAPSREEFVDGQAQRFFDQYMFPDLQST